MSPEVNEIKMPESSLDPKINPIKGRGAVSTPVGRFEQQSSEQVDDGWDGDEAQEFVDPKSPKTILRWQNARKMITVNDSPDIPHGYSMNPYLGCEHGCVYCFARPSHAYLNLSPGLDFETRIFAKRDAVTALRKDLSKPGYKPQPIALGINTDAYQPAEKRLKITRQLLELLLECKHPVSLLSKSALIERDLDILQEMAQLGLVSTAISITSLNRSLCNSLEPRAADPSRRLRTVQSLSSAGVPVSVMMAPIIPAINDQEIEDVLSASAEAGARSAGYIVLRLPHELKTVFSDWLQTHYPMRAAKVLRKLTDLHGGKLYDAQFFQRQRGTGVYADLIRSRFERARKKYFKAMPRQTLRSDLFSPPGGRQGSMF
jgi:DNA repair photolyase